MHTNPESSMSRVLHIEDDPAYRDLVTHRLQEFFVVDCAASIAEAEDKIRSGNYSAILLDPGLPDSDKNTAFQKIKRANPNAAIVILTGYDDEEWTRRQIRECASGVLVKGRNDREPATFASAILRAICTYRACYGLELATPEKPKGC